MYSLLFKDKDINLLFILSILNSKLFSYFMRMVGTEIRGGYIRFNPRFVNNFSIPNVDKDTENKLSSLVENIISLNKKLSIEKNPNSITMLNRQINAVDKQIDALVYKLYNLNDEEVKIVEGD